MVPPPSRRHSRAETSVATHRPRHRHPLGSHRRRHLSEKPPRLGCLNCLRNNRRPTRRWGCSFPPPKKACSAQPESIMISGAYPIPPWHLSSASSLGSVLSSPFTSVTQSTPPPSPQVVPSAFTVYQPQAVAGTLPPLSESASSVCSSSSSASKAYSGVAKKSEEASNVGQRHSRSYLNSGNESD